jgi:hypothetical protein
MKLGIRVAAAVQALFHTPFFQDSRYFEHAAIGLLVAVHLMVFVA